MKMFIMLIVTGEFRRRCHVPIATPRTSGRDHSGLGPDAETEMQQEKEEAHGVCACNPAQLV